MNPPAAFRATVHSLRQVPSRKICQLVLELPIEETASVAAIAEHGAWVGIARLQNPDDVRPFPSKGKGLVDIAVSSAPHSIPEGAAPATSGQEREVSAPPAPLNPDKRKWLELPLYQQASMRCREPRFRKFLEEWRGDNFNDEESAADFVRSFCRVASRRHILEFTESADKWAHIENRFQAWLLGTQVGAPA